MFEFPACEIRSGGSVALGVFCGVGSTGRGERYDRENSSRNLRIADDGTPEFDVLFIVCADDALSGGASTLTSF